MSRLEELINKVELTKEELDELKNIEGITVEDYIASTVYYEVIVDNQLYYVYIN